MPQRQILVVIVVIFAIVAWASQHTQKLLNPVKTLKTMYVDQARLKTGDMLLWSYSLSLRTDFEKLITGSQYTHVSIVFIDAVGTVYSWETVATGNRLVRLEVDLANPRYHCIWRPINREVNWQEFSNIVQECQGVPYSFNFWKGLLHRWAPHFTPQEEDDENPQTPRFCSELAAYTYERLGVMDFSTSPLTHSVMLPRNFCYDMDDSLPTTSWYSFGPEIRLKYRLLPSQ